MQAITSHTLTQEERRLRRQVQVRESKVIVQNTRLARRNAALASRMLTASAIAALATGCVFYSSPGSNDLVPDKNMVGVSVAAVGHLGSEMGVPTYSIDGHPMGRSKGWGGGGAINCCVLVPRTVTQPLMIKVKWQTCDVGHIKFVNDVAVDPTQRCRKEEHEATVPINFSVSPGNGSGLVIHFLPGHRVEAWYSREAPESDQYPGPSFPRRPAPRYAPIAGEEAQSGHANAKSEERRAQQ